MHQEVPAAEEIGFQNCRDEVFSGGPYGLSPGFQLRRRRLTSCFASSPGFE